MAIRRRLRHDRLNSAWAKETSIDTADGVDNFTTTAAWFNNMAGAIRLQELEAGEINHALFLYTNRTWSDAVYPAHATTTAVRCPSPQAAPPLGAQLQLDPDYVLPSGLPQWKYPILRALQTYGAYVDDTGAYSRSISFGIQLESGQHYLRHGEATALANGLTPTKPKATSPPASTAPPTTYSTSHAASTGHDCASYTHAAHKEPADELGQVRRQPAEQSQRDAPICTRSMPRIGPAPVSAPVDILSSHAPPRGLGRGRGVAIDRWLW